MNSDETILRRVKNARTINDGQDVVVNDGNGGYIGSAGAMLWFLLGEAAPEFDEDRDYDLPFETNDEAG